MLTPEKPLAGNSSAAACKMAWRFSGFFGRPSFWGFRRFITLVYQLVQYNDIEGQEQNKKEFWEKKDFLQSSVIEPELRIQENKLKSKKIDVKKGSDMKTSIFQKDLENVSNEDNKGI